MALRVLSGFTQRQNNRVRKAEHTGYQTLEGSGDYVQNSRRFRNPCAAAIKAVWGQVVCSCSDSAGMAPSQAVSNDLISIASTEPNADRALDTESKQTDVSGQQEDSNDAKIRFPRQHFDLGDGT
jgi:hypothetical protein